jgi:hypothetical protein
MDVVERILPNILVEDIGGVDHLPDEISDLMNY